MKKLLISIAAVLLAAATASAQGPALSSTYVLRKGSQFAQGCIPPCMCPVWLVPDFRGTFHLEKTVSSDPAFEEYAITDVNWLAGPPESEIRVVGAGSYRVGTPAGALVQQLVLDLRVGADPLTTYDSGLLPGGSGGSHPDIDLPLSAASVACFGTFMHVQAKAAPLSAITSYKVVLGSYQEGCLPPCNCPTYAPIPVSGTFDLVRVFQGRDWVEFGVVNVDWALHAFPPPLPAFIPAAGAGIYRVQGSFSGGLHRMLLDLNVGGTDERYDSGVVLGAQMPRIDISLAMNGFFCYDQVFWILAGPK
ncbi:MAG: hypothetical protein HY812_15055 [Planctomycetes bacterium]|nr:hypothetical protein [Planctomycetota bacterium]